MKTYLNISFNQKDQAKAEARENGTRIQWDASIKKWYWQGEGDMPQFLNKFLNKYQQPQQRQPRYGFQQSDASAAEAIGISVEQLRAEEKAKHDAMMPSAEEIAELERLAELDMRQRR